MDKGEKEEGVDDDGDVRKKVKEKRLQGLELLQYVQNEELKLAAQGKNSRTVEEQEAIFNEILMEKGLAPYSVYKEAGVFDDPRYIRRVAMQAAEGREDGELVDEGHRESGNQLTEEKSTQTEKKNTEN